MLSLSCACSCRISVLNLAIFVKWGSGLHTAPLIPHVHWFSEIRFSKITSFHCYMTLSTEGNFYIDNFSPGLNIFIHSHTQYFVQQHSSVRCVHFHHSRQCSEILYTCFRFEAGVPLFIHKYFCLGSKNHLLKQTSRKPTRDMLVV